jgi:phosphoglycolate phosphatase-like HAD superfamily hydrolase
MSRAPRGPDLRLPSQNLFSRRLLLGIAPTAIAVSPISRHLVRGMGAPLGDSTTIAETRSAVFIRRGEKSRVAPQIGGSPGLDEARLEGMIDALSMTATDNLTTEAALPSWRVGDATRAVLEFVRRASEEVPVEERVAVFDNDGTLWCEKPMPIQLDFILRRFVEMAEADPELRARQPWKAAYEQDYGWLSSILAEHYAGDDRNVQILAGGIPSAYDGITVEDFEARSDAFLRNAKHPTLGRGYLQCAYAPMVDLLNYLAANGFANYIASGGGRDFMRPISHEVYGIPRERVIGSTAALDYRSDDHGGKIVHMAEADYLDDGPEKPIRIWSRTGRRPLLAAGNSNGDIPMLHFTQHTDRPFLRLLILHDDSEREFDYTAGAEQALEQAQRDDWTVVSVRHDWLTVF